MTLQNDKELRHRIEEQFVSVFNNEKLTKNDLEIKNRINFIFKTGVDYYYKFKPQLTLNDIHATRKLLEEEKKLTIKFQDFEKAGKIYDLLKSLNEISQIYYFEIAYKIEHLANESNVYFDTNFLIFKYKMIGIE